MKSEVTTVINKPCCLIYHIRGNDDRAKELTESPPGVWTLEQACSTRDLWVKRDSSRTVAKMKKNSVKAVKRVMHDFNISETNV